MDFEEEEEEGGGIEKILLKKFTRNLKEKLNTNKIHATIKFIKIRYIIIYYKQIIFYFLSLITTVFYEIHCVS